MALELKETVTALHGSKETLFPPIAAISVMLVQVTKASSDMFSCRLHAPDCIFQLTFDTYF
jgi:hypothetical protein